MSVVNYYIATFSLAVILMLPATVSALSIGQTDTFEDGTTQNWVVGNPDGIVPFPPANSATGGPAGACDSYMLLTSIGGSGPSSRLAVINMAQWTGDYLSAGVGAITMDVRNQGSTDLYLRLLVADPILSLPPANVALSTGPVFLPAGSGWTAASFLLDPVHLTPRRGSVISALANATELRIFHNDIAGFPPPPLAARLGIDNIMAISSSVLPIADAGADQTIHIGEAVQLDGSGSSDPGGSTPLSYFWSLANKPEGSAAFISDPGVVNPAFTSDMPGDYGIQLVVMNSGGWVSAPSVVTISNTNSAPVADAGQDQGVAVTGAVITLDGSQSFDADGDPIAYQWSIISKPAGSVATLSDPEAVNPTFVADRHGSYVVQLIVSDSWASSSPVLVTISFENVVPLADAGLGRIAVIGDAVVLDGTGSSDADGDPLTYSWSFTTVPQGSAAVISDPETAQPSFLPDATGTYVVQLIVHDGISNSAPVTVEVDVISEAVAVIMRIQELEAFMLSLDDADFKAVDRKLDLINNLESVSRKIDRGRYQKALRKLRLDILQRTNGCVTSGLPGRNDWITDCTAQTPVYAEITGIIAEVKRLRDLKRASVSAAQAP